MPLRDKLWRASTVHAMAVAFLQAEQPRLEQHAEFTTADAALLGKPDLSNPGHNHRRLRLLYRLRAPLLAEIPPDTVWYEVADFTPAEFSEIHFIARCGWDDPDNRDSNQLTAAAKRQNKILQTPPSQWPMPILWGHDKTGPFTIIEGNNRLAAFASAESMPDFSIPVIVGLSPTPFYFHIFDAPNFLANDLWNVAN